jgi:hypothetical protein
MVVLLEESGENYRLLYAGTVPEDFSLIFHQVARTMRRTIDKPAPNQAKNTRRRTAMVQARRPPGPGIALC